MKYEQPTFTVGQPSRVTACERCVYGSGEHAAWCRQEQIRRVRAKDIGDRHSGYLVPHILVTEACPEGEVYFVSPRHPNEPEDEWAKRCGVIVNFGKPTRA